MEHTQILDITETNIVSKDSAFIEANTIESSLDEIKSEHIIPVFIKDNEPLISQADFIQATNDVLSDVFHGEKILQPNIRLSHPIKGRIPEAKDKPAAQLQDHEKTLYYERMAFVIEVPSIHDEIAGSNLSLTIGGVKALNMDNLYSKKGADEHFKIFIGFQNKVCTNLCVWTDGYMNDIKVTTIGQLKACIRTLIDNYNANYHIEAMRILSDFNLTEKQFATLIGRCRMYPHLPKPLQNEIPALQLGDSQINTVVKDFYRDKSFCRDKDGNINLWKLYNLFTGANKSTYIDNFLERSVNAYSFTEQLKFALNKQTESWFLN
ncbi:MAG: DUF3871 family protein [Sphingobacteriales bacterium]|nr:DUF3871 family protein [Sphingobacteriales bacterium]